MAATDDRSEEAIDRRSGVTRCQHRHDSDGAVVGCCIGCTLFIAVDHNNDDGVLVHGCISDGSPRARGAHRCCRASPRPGTSCSAGDVSIDDRVSLDGRCAASGSVDDYDDHSGAAGDHDDRPGSCRDLRSLRCLPLR
jgi:hypothetical protein